MLILLSISFLGYSQSHELKYNAGVNLANTTGYAYDTENRIAPMLSVEYLLVSENNWFYSFGLGYSSKGHSEKIYFTFDDGSFDRTEDSHLKLNYLVLPLKIGYSLGSKWNFKPSVGISLGKYLSGEMELRDQQTGEYLVTDAPNPASFEVSALADLSISHDINEKFSIGPSIGYHYALTKASKLDYYLWEDLKTRAISATISLTYHLD